MNGVTDPQPWSAAPLPPPFARSHHPTLLSLHRKATKPMAASRFSAFSKVTKGRRPEPGLRLSPLENAIFALADDLNLTSDELLQLSDATDEQFQDVVNRWQTETRSKAARATAARAEASPSRKLEIRAFEKLTPCRQ